MNHKTKSIEFNGELIEIDEKIAPLILKMWKLGIITNGCCQSHCRPHCNHKWKKIEYDDNSTYYKKILTRDCHKYIWISFNHAVDIEKFYNYVGEYNERYDSMYSKMHGQCYKGRNKNSNWILDILPINRGEKKIIIREPASKADCMAKGAFVERYESIGCNNNKFNMMIQLSFPKRHLAYVEKRLDLALSRKNKNEY